MNEISDAHVWDHQFSLTSQIILLLLIYSSTQINQVAFYLKVMRLPYTTAESEIGIWRWVAIAASVFGLTLGAWRVKAAGAVATFGEFPQLMANGLQTATNAAAQSAIFVAKLIEKIEQWFDSAARMTSVAAMQFARAANVAEEGFDWTARMTSVAAMQFARAASVAEEGFDWTAQAIGTSTIHAANASEIAETRGFDDGIDWFAALFGRTGENLRPLQTGKIYLNSMTLFVWVLLIGVLFVLIWW